MDCYRAFEAFNIGFSLSLITKNYLLHHFITASSLYVIGVNASILGVENLSNTFAGVLLLFLGEFIVLDLSRLLVNLFPSYGKFLIRVGWV